MEGGVVGVSERELREEGAAVGCCWGLHCVLHADCLGVLIQLAIYSRMDGVD